MTTLERLRIKRGLSRYALAAAARISERTIYHLETVEPRGKVQGRIREGLLSALGVPAEKLFDSRGRVR